MHPQDWGYSSAVERLLRIYDVWWKRDDVGGRGGRGEVGDAPPVPCWDLIKPILPPHFSLPAIFLSPSSPPNSLPLHLTKSMLLGILLKIRFLLNLMVIH